MTQQLDWVNIRPHWFPVDVFLPFCRLPINLSYVRSYKKSTTPTSTNVLTSSTCPGVSRTSLKRASACSWRSDIMPGHSPGRAASLSNMKFGGHVHHESAHTKVSRTHAWKHTSGQKKLLCSPPPDFFENHHEETHKKKNNKKHFGLEVPINCLGNVPWTFLKIILPKRVSPSNMKFGSHG